MVKVILFTCFYCGKGSSGIIFYSEGKYACASCNAYNLKKTKKVYTGKVVSKETTKLVNAILDDYYLEAQPEDTLANDIQEVRKEQCRST